MRGILFLMVAGALVACGGEAGQLSDHAETFDALVTTSPKQVQPGQWVKFEMQMKSDFSRQMKVNLTLKLVEDFNSKLVYTHRWEGVSFDVGEVYNITDNYLTATDTTRTAHHVELEATDVDTGDVVWTDSGAGTVQFSY